MELFDPTTLGPDPEPFGMRFERLAGWPPTPRKVVLGPPASCPLAAAYGDQAPCAGGNCPFFRVPGARYACAVDEWSPQARRDARVADWFIDLRDRVGYSG